jgi:hypothetical protein
VPDHDRPVRPTDELKRIVGDGVLKAVTTVDQAYAAPQERSFWETGPLAGVEIRNHPGGGIPAFLGSQVKGTGLQDIHSWVSNALGERRPVVDSAADTVNEYIRGVRNLAPKQTGNLSKSGAGQVISDGAVVYDRPPEVPRLSKEELAAGRHRRVRPDRKRKRAF